MKKIIVFASGSGTNAENIIKYFSNIEIAKVVSVFTNNASAKVIERAKNHQIPVEIFEKNELLERNVLQKIQKIDPDLIVLAGFLLKFPENIIEQYPNKIINIHPALLPKYGGKGMYGMHIHRAIVNNKEKETGISIHYVNENYDEGGIIFQQNVVLTDEDTPETVAEKIHELEQKHFPEIIHRILEDSDSKI
ncbi:phosphoribosylglycinamide formyltransferase [Flavobacterium sp. WLB]|uniref:Phosphoribosylglycinamide formyltransferase n=1 Tax=Flavobacterium panici TaxID=2654843 RepID=A0A9N8IZY0_9FLAO|nr:MULTISPECIES: phosphoribosylglycinamide formyltransferase [Flavobacterium]KOP37223.1 phosphoribosylglycinamide formyltransferase [Flavobacterium sp. VMW]OWU88736.1 phosphoribosylglycinamide formyltransferase [Flavobacterium sp. NLM]PUU68011.1 phosphoribosylglycinamide formyltransferase [Flavobacterium sp. WLB]UUF15695.1 phosphoribosylglycinamide formyltransferase [Flavobacterium panici]CAC9973689.1 phosphoribosylglycinamide formyltransferase [Flavobacterium panici]